MAIPGVETIIDRLGGLAPLVPLQPRGLHREPGDERMGPAEPDAHSHSEEVDHLPWRRTRAVVPGPAGPPEAEPRPSGDGRMAIVHPRDHPSPAPFPAADDGGHPVPARRVGRGGGGPFGGGALSWPPPISGAGGRGSRKEGGGVPGPRGP